MKIQVLGIGKVKELFYRDGVEEYRKRIQRYTAIDVVETARERSGSKKDLEAAYGKIRKRHLSAELKVALDERGDMMTSIELSRWLQGVMMKGTKRLSFVLGGAYGLAEMARDDSDKVLSLSSMTLPHQMARLFLLEQMYRAFTIIGGEPYHK